MILSSVWNFVKFGKMVQSPSAPKSMYRGKSSLLSRVPHHPYHLVDPSPWPALTSLSILWMMLGFVLFFHKYAAAGTVLLTGILRVTYTSSLWWRDVMRESLQGCHTSKVKDGLHLGMILFIVSEAMFFVGLLWAFMHVALMPTVQIGMMWPPLGIAPVEWTGLPKTNTALLLASYFTANAAKHALDSGDRKGCAMQLALTIGLGVAFVYCQYLEYTGAPFTFSDSVYGSTFYLCTGFHGLHVVVGFAYLTVALCTLNSRKPGHSTALDLSILYWHFVDVVWVFLLVLIYVWGGSVPTPDASLRTDGESLLRTVLHSRKLYSFKNGEML